MCVCFDHAYTRCGCVVCRTSVSKRSQLTQRSLVFNPLASPRRIYDYLSEVPNVGFVRNVPLYNESKVAILVENRPTKILAPLVIHFISVLPADWRVRFMGSDASVQQVNRSAAIRSQVTRGKLDLTYIPDNVSVSGQEQISSFLTNLWVAEELLRPAEWLLIFQTDSMLCASHPDRTIDSWLDYTWVGAPWAEHSHYGGNGGLSLRCVSAMVQVLRHQRRLNHSDPEDVWLTERLGHLPGSRAANGSESKKFSVETIWYESPLGYHTGGSGAWLLLGVWGRPDQRSHIYNYCPEMKMILDMDLEEVIGQGCNLIW